MKKTLLLLTAAIIAAAHSAALDAKDLYVGFTIFDAGSVDAIPKISRDLDKSPTKIAGNYFGLFSPDQAGEVVEISKRFYLLEQRQGPQSAIVGTANSVFQKIRAASFPDSISAVYCLFFTDGIETRLSISALKTEEPRLLELTKSAVTWPTPVLSYAVEVRPSGTYSDDPNRQGLGVLQALAGGEEKNQFKLTDFENPLSPLNQTLDRIAQAEGDLAVCFILDRSLSLHDQSVANTVVNAVEQAIAKLFASPKEAGEWIKIKGGEFTMGSDYDPSEAPAHRVRVDSFTMNAYEVTEALFYRVMGPPEKAERYKNSKMPITCSWFDAVEFCNRYSIDEKRKPAYVIRPGGTVERVPGAKGFRLPTEAERDYAAGAGTAGPYYTGDTISPEDANYGSDKALPVGSLRPNPWGLYDIAGNVREWCEDYYGDYQDGPPAQNPRGPSSGVTRVMRGGSFLEGMEAMRTSYRCHETPDFNDEYVGFRIVYSD